MMKKIFAFLSLLFTTQNVFADFITQNIPNACNANKVFLTQFTINSYTCNPGEYLPAHTLGCSACPSGYTCNGGTFDFKDTEFQGAKKSSPLITQSLNDLCAANSPKRFSAKFTPNIHTCTPGYYLPAGVDACTICQQNNYCVGGTYLFNETIDQGIEQCTNGHAPVGSSVCYPHILHIGDDMVYLKSTKLTTPSLNVGMDDGVFYANMTTTPTPMNAATEHYLKIEYGGTVYYVCDDSTFNK